MSLLSYQCICLYTYQWVLYSHMLLHGCLESSVLTWRTPFSTSCKAGLVTINSFSLCLFGLFFSSFLKDSFARFSITGWKFLSFSTLSIYFHSLLACKVSAEKSINSLMRSHFIYQVAFYIAAFKVLFLWLLTVWLHAPCEFLWFILCEVCWGS